MNTNIPWKLTMGKPTFSFVFLLWPKEKNKDGVLQLIFTRRFPTFQHAPQKTLA